LKKDACCPANEITAGKGYLKKIQKENCPAVDGHQYLSGSKNGIRKRIGL